MTITLRWYEYDGLAGDQHVLLVLHDGAGHRVDRLFDRWAPFMGMRRRLALWRLRRRWVREHVKGPNLAWSNCWADHL